MRLLTKDEDQAAHTLATREEGAPSPLGRVPYLVGPLELLRPQPQLHIFTFEEKKNQSEGFIAFYDTESPPSPVLPRVG